MLLKCGLSQCIIHSHMFALNCVHNHIRVRLISVNLHFTIKYCDNICMCRIIRLADMNILNMLRHSFMMPGKCTNHAHRVWARNASSCYMLYMVGNKHRVVVMLALSVMYEMCSCLIDVLFMKRNNLAPTTICAQKFYGFHTIIISSVDHRP
jgi:hypothetical protein